VATVYQESPVQIKDFPEVQATQGMSEILYQKIQLLMKWMQDDPYLIITPTLPTDTQERSPMDSSGPESTNLGNTDGLGNTGSTTSSVNSPVDRTNQTEVGWVSIETRAPNPLSKLIHIYSDDESPEPSHDSPVHVQEEKGPEKVSSPEPKVQDKEVSQKETKAESGLDTKEPNESKTKVDLNDELELEETKKGSPQKEINSSAADEKVSNESIPDTSILSQHSNP
jgi:hypothetical protein